MEIINDGGCLFDRDLLIEGYKLMVSKTLPSKVKIYREHNGYCFIYKSIWITSPEKKKITIKYPIHRLVMNGYRNGKRLELLRESQDVHHLNWLPWDCRLENLRVMDRDKHQELHKNMGKSYVPEINYKRSDIDDLLGGMFLLDYLGD